MSTTETPAGRGRPRTFDRERVLDTIVELFWTKGYEATSVADIVAATGLSKSSLYGAFGSKKELLDTALNRYLETVFGEFLAAFVGAERGLADVHRFVDAYHEWLLGDAAGRGCLAINTANELGYSDDSISRYAAVYRSIVRAAVRAPLERAAGLGEIDGAMVDSAVEQVLGLSLAASVFSRSGSERDELRRLAEATHRMIDSWPSPAGH